MIQRNITVDSDDNIHHNEDEQEHHETPIAYVNIPPVDELLTRPNVRNVDIPPVDEPSTRPSVRRFVFQSSRSVVASSSKVISKKILI